MDIGYAILYTAFFTSIAAVIMYIAGIVKKNKTFFDSGKSAIIISALLLTTASFYLLYLIINRDYNVEYIALYTSNDLSFFYTVSAFWAGGDGSLLLWTWFISIFVAVVVIREKRDSLLVHALPVMALIQAYFLFIIITQSNPFSRLDFMPPDGNGLNPLLQDPGMVFHPPTLFLGYAGFVIPFAFMLAGVFLEKEDWVFRIRRWTMFSWLFLTLGNLFGSYWAYTMLNWGGYWGWDPVENASFMPWITATAFFHSFMIQEKRQGLKIWNIILILATFELVILGTLLTRSGIIDSVHSFGQSNVAPHFIWFMVAVLVVTLGLLVFKYKKLTSRRILNSPISREGSFLANNWIFMAATFAVVWGTLYPLVSDIFRGYRVMVGPQFFNEVITPLSLALVLLMGLCPLIGWRKASIANLKKSYTYPLIIAVSVTVLSAIAGILKPYMLIVIFACVFALLTHLLDTSRAVMNNHKKDAQNGILKSSISTLMNNKRTYGGYIAHIGILLLVVGVAGSTLYQYEDTATIYPGKKHVIEDYSFILSKIITYPEKNREVTAGVIDVFKKGQYLGTVESAMYYYPKQNQDVVKPSVATYSLDDIYFSTQGFGDGNQTVKIKVIPLMSLIWAGAIAITFGTVFAMLEIVVNKRKNYYETRYDI